MATNANKCSAESGGWWELFQPFSCFTDPSSHHGISRRSSWSPIRLVLSDVPAGPCVSEIAEKGASNS